MLPGLSQAAQVGDRDQRDRQQRDLDPNVVEPGGDRDQLLHGRRGRHGHRHHVVDEQRRRGNEPQQGRQLGPRDGIGATAVGEGAAHLAVRQRDHGEQEGDRDRHLDD